MMHTEISCYELLSERRSWHIYPGLIDRAYSVHIHGAAVCNRIAEKGPLLRRNMNATFNLNSSKGESFYDMTNSLGYLHLRQVVKCDHRKTAQVFYQPFSNCKAFWAYLLCCRQLNRAFAARERLLSNLLPNNSKFVLGRKMKKIP